VERFMTAASPGIIATTLLNAYYASYEHYVMALARQMQHEYEFIHAQGFTLQLDCPDLTMERTRYFQDDALERFQEIVALHIDAINLAIANIPPEHIRLHVCWGNSDGPHVHDVPLEAILPLRSIRHGSGPCLLNSPIPATSMNTKCSSVIHYLVRCCLCLV